MELSERSMDKFIVKDTTPWWRFWKPRWEIYSRGWLDKQPTLTSDLVYRAGFEGKAAAIKALHRKDQLEQEWINRQIMERSPNG